VRNTLHDRSRAVRIADVLFVLAGVGVLLLFTTRYLMPFRLDDVLFIDWARTHTFWDAWSPARGQILLGFRPIVAATMWLLTHAAGTNYYAPWHITLVATFLIGLNFAGRTSRYLASTETNPYGSLALYFTVGLYWIACTSILNVLFWFSDMTYTLEIMFTCAAWYFGIRGMREGDMRSWLIASVLGACAVMSKEPAVLLVHTVWLGFFVLNFKVIREAWQKRERSQQMLALGLYCFVIATTLFVILSSPVGATRFFPLSIIADTQNHFIYDRLRYYSSIILAPFPRVLLLVPIVALTMHAILGRLKFFSNPLLRVLLAITLAVFIVLFILPWLPFAVGAIVLSLLILILLKPEARSARAMLPFAIALVVISCALLLTIMMVKTQLTEFAIVLLVISGWAWSEMIGLICTAMNTLQRPKLVRNVLISCLILIVLFSGNLIYSKFAVQERILRSVQGVRLQANEAIQWAAKNLPQNATLGVCTYRLHGIANGGDLTGMDDAAKVERQYTFMEGFVFDYLRVLGRPDIHPNYFNDRNSLSASLDSLRLQPNSYLFIQSALDHQVISSVTGLILPSDSLIKRSSHTTTPSEIWMLRK
jgi:hypothetical protein